SLETVKEFIIRAAADCHVELTTLIVPGENDGISEMEEEAAWIASVEDAAGKTIPLHVTRFFPRYQMYDKAATDIAHIHRLADTAKKYLNYVFVGNC
ncbi:MAG: radical SAM protein, partial [Ruminococcus flavefaciens]|nr:radical SAM protein [Ruminococcus flavefaciens]